MGILKEILSKPLFRATTLNGLSIILKIAIGFITSKFIAVFVGPAGMALVGNMRNFLTSIEAIGTLGFENGIIKYVAEHKEEKEKLQKTLSTIFVSVLASCCILMIVLLLFSEYFNDTLFGAQFHFSFVFRLLALALPFYIGNIVVIAAINGLNEYKRVIQLNIIGSCIGLIVSVLLIWQLRIEGAMLSLIVTPALLFFVSFVTLNKEVPLFQNIRFRNLSTAFLKDLSSYSIMALVAALIGPAVYLLIRKNIIENIGIEEAGFWESICRISSYYFIFITSIITIYFLPKLSLAKNNRETKSLFLKYYKGIMPVFIIGVVGIYLFREIIINVLFTKEFLPVTKLFFWQLIGDVFKAASFILGFQFYAKKLTRAFIVSEIFSLAVLYFSSLYFLSVYQIEGVVMAHAFTYLVYFITLSVYFRKSLV